MITEMYKRIVLNLDNPSSTINIQSLTKGVYVLAAKTNGVVRNQLIVKE